MLGNDQLVGLVTEVDLPADWQADHRMWLEAEESGWWYSAVLPDRRMIVAHMTDNDLLRRGMRSVADLRLRLDRVPYTKLCLPLDGALIRQRVISARSYLMERVAGTNWAAVGDAAMAWDPISGQGITRALEGGLLCSERHFGIRRRRSICPVCLRRVDGRVAPALP